MKKASKILSIVLPVMVIAMFMFVAIAPVVMAVPTEDTMSNFPTTTTSIGTVDNMVNQVWGTVLTIAQILAFAAIVFAGVRYMFASADQKADIKKGLVYLVVGAILVFAASTVVKIVVLGANNVKEGVGASTEIVRTIENV